MKKYALSGAMLVISLIMGSSVAHAKNVTATSTPSATTNASANAQGHKGHFTTGAPVDFSSIKAHMTKNLENQISRYQSFIDQIPSSLSSDDTKALTDDVETAIDHLNASLAVLKIATTTESYSKILIASKVAPTESDALTGMKVSLLSSAFRIQLATSTDASGHAHSRASHVHTSQQITSLATSTPTSSLEIIASSDSTSSPSASASYTSQSFAGTPSIEIPQDLIHQVIMLTSPKDAPSLMKQLRREAVFHSNSEITYPRINHIIPNSIPVVKSVVTPDTNPVLDDLSTTTDATTTVIDTSISTTTLPQSTTDDTSSTTNATSTDQTSSDTTDTAATSTTATSTDSTDATGSASTTDATATIATTTDATTAGASDSSVTPATTTDTTSSQSDTIDTNTDASTTGQ
jgi:hypothetical protein